MPAAIGRLSAYHAAVGRAIAGLQFIIGYHPLAFDAYYLVRNVIHHRLLAQIGTCVRAGRKGDCQYFIPRQGLVAEALVAWLGPQSTGSCNLCFIILGRWLRAGFTVFLRFAEHLFGFLSLL